jgi:hypothetical protein
MSDDVGAESAVEAAAYGALVASPKLKAAEAAKPSALATVYQHVPQDTRPPLVIIADIEMETFGATKDDDDDQAGTLAIIAQTEGEARKPVLTLQRGIKAALHNHREDRDGWSLRFTFLSSDGVLLEDGKTYEGRSLFNVLALANS